MKKFTVCILVFVMIFSSLSVFTYAEENVMPVSLQKEVKFLDMLGITDISEKDEIITRAKFCDMLMKSMNVDNFSYQDGLFYDVSYSTEYSDSIGAAYSLGIIGGGGNGMFTPESPITMEAALKMCVAALGYERVANALGGYPVGYISVAKEIDLEDGVNLGQEFTNDDIYILLYNFLISDSATISYVKNEGAVNIKRNEGDTPLSRYFSLKKDTGILKSAGHVSMLSEFDETEPKVYVNGVNYKTTVASPEIYLGLYADIYYDKYNCVRAIYPHTINSFVEKSYDEIDGLKGNTLITYDEKGREDEIKLELSYSFVKNGRIKNASEADFKVENAQYTFIDNDGNGRYDVVTAQIPDYIIVSSTDVVEGIVFDTNGSGKHLDLNLENKVCYEFTFIDEEGTTSPIIMEDLSKGDVIKYCKSEDGKYITGEVTKRSITASIEEKGEDYIVISGTSYKTNCRFNGIDELKFGMEYLFYIASDNTITYAVTSNSNQMQYGFIVAFGAKQIGLAYRTNLKILTPENEVVAYELADKITLDSYTGVKNNDERIREKFTNEKDRTITKYQLIRYLLNSEGKISKIDTATELAKEEFTPDKLIEDSGKDDILTRHLHNQSVFYHGSYRVLAPNAVIGPQTLMLSLPTDFETQGETPKEYDEDEFAFVTTANLPSYETVSVTMYDIDRNLQPGVVVFYKGASGANAVVSNKATPAVVKSVTKGLNEDGDETTLISLYQGSSSYKLLVDKEKNATLSNDDLPTSGDIIRYVLNKKGEIANFVIDLNYIPATANEKAKLETTDKTVNSGLGNDMISFGKSYFHSSSTLAMLIEGGKAGGHEYLAGISTYQMPSNVRVVVYDGASKSAKPGNIGMLADALSVGEDAASLIAVKCYSHQLSDIFIYK